MLAQNYDSVFISCNFITPLGLSMTHIFVLYYVLSTCTLKFTVYKHFVIFFISHLLKLIKSYFQSLPYANKRAGYDNL